MLEVKNNNILQAGSKIILQSLTTNKCVTLTQTNEITALGSKSNGKSIWNVIQGHNLADPTIIRLQHDKEKVFLQLNEQGKVSVTQKQNSSCDIQIHAHVLESCFSFKFCKSPNNFLGFNKEGYLKNPKKSSREDIFSISSVQKSNDITENGNQLSLITNTPDPSSFFLKNILLNIMPKNCQIPRFLTNDCFDSYCYKRAQEYNDYFTKQNCDIDVTYFGKLYIRICEAELKISKVNRKIYFFLRCNIPCFGTEFYDELRIDANGKYPNFSFDTNEYCVPIFQAFGSTIGRQLSDINIEMFRNRPKWFDRKESEGYLHLSPIIKETDILASFEENIKLKCAFGEPKGNLSFQLRFEKN